MKLYEMEGFLRGKCIPGDLKVNETNAEYLVRKFSEAEERCAALSAKLSMINDLIEAAEQANKLAQEAAETLVQERNALAAENARLSDIAKGGAFVMQKALMKYEFGVGMTMQAEDFIRDARSNPPPPTLFWLRCRLVLVTRASTMPPAA